MDVKLYAPPSNTSLAESLHLIFSHYCTPWKSNIGTAGGFSPKKDTPPTMDGVSFARMCKEAPELCNFIGRTDIDLIFSKTKPYGARKLDFDHFLDVLLAIAERIYPDDDPRVALANFLARFIFALFDQPPAEDGANVVENIHEQLLMKD